MRGDIGSTWIVDGGDGDQTVFGERLVARRVQEPWFGGELPRGEAYLLQVEDGRLSGTYLAFTSRQTASLSEQLERGPWVRVVVHTINKPGSDFEADAVGMAAVEVV
jgi:hypothetical protein